MCQKMKKLNNRNNIYIIIALQFALLFLLFNPLTNYEVTSFEDRIMGNGLMSNVDVTKRVNSFYILLFAIIPISVIVIYKLLKKVLDKTNSRTLKFMELISVLGIINTILALSNKIQNSEKLLTTVYILNIINILIILNVLVCKMFKKEFNFQNVKWALISAIPIAFVCTLVLHKLNIIIGSVNMNWLISYVIGVIVLLILISLKFINKEILKKAYILFMIAPLLEMIYLEVYNILNQYNIILTHKIKTIVAIYGICMIASIIYYFINCKRKIIFRYTKYYYPIILITFGAIIAALTMTTTVNTDFFESANHGMGIYEFFRYGKIPLIETFDAHMLSNQLFGIVYGYLNNDIIGAVFGIYNSYKQILYCIILYCLLKKIFSRDTSFLITLFFPLQLDLGLNTYYIGLIAVITLLNAIKNKKFSSYLVYWTSLAFLCVWQLDIGYSISIATVAVLMYTLIKDRKKANTNLKNIIIPLVIVISAFLVFYVGVCLVKNINPITRAIEFLKVAMSNVNWGYSNLGNSKKVAYIVSYYVMPLIMVLSLIYVIYKNKKSTQLNITLLALGIFYILNMQRGMIRHSLVENKTNFIMSFSSLYIAFFVMKYYKKNLKMFLTTYIVIVVINGLLLSTDIKIYSNIFEDAISKYTKFELQDEYYMQKEKRIKLSDRMKNEYRDLKNILDILLDDNETYLDFSNQTLLYALLDKEKPVYVNQSPGLLSGELTQHMFIEEIRNKNNVNFVLMGENKLLSKNIDGIINDYRYYLISEYIYQNFTPIISINGYDIWVKNEKYLDILEKSQKIENNKMRILTKEQYIEKNKNTIKLGYIPYTWGEYDEKQEEKVIQRADVNLEIEEGQDIEIRIDNTMKENGNYIKLRIDSSQNANVSIKLYENEELFAEYAFVVKKGEYDYIIRSSSTYAWYEKNINKLQIKSDKEAKLIGISILEANTIKEYK